MLDDDHDILILQPVQIFSEFRKYKLKMLGLSETWSTKMISLSKKVIFLELVWIEHDKQYIISNITWQYADIL